MGSQPNLASRSEVVSISKCSIKISGEPSPNIWGAKNIKFRTIFSATSALDTAYRERNVASTNKNAVNLQCACPIKGNLLFVIIDPETAEIRLLIVTHPSAAIMLHDHQSCDMSSYSKFSN